MTTIARRLALIALVLGVVLVLYLGPRNMPSQRLKPLD